MIVSDPWKRAEQMARNHDQGASKWLKLVDGEKKVVVFLGDPHPREVVFQEGKYATFDDSHRAQGLKSSLRVSFNVAIYNTKEIRIFEQGSMFFKDLLRVREKFRLDRWAFEIQRNGAAGDPKTTYSILPERELTPEQQKAYQALPLFDLVELYGGNAAAQPTPVSQGAGPAAVGETGPTPATAVPQADDDRDLPF
jgi:hypothetical protein